MSRTSDKRFTITCVQTTRQPLALARFSRIAKLALHVLGVRKAAINIVFVGESRMAKIATRSGKAGVTNVLAFAYREGREEVLGDVIICVPFAAGEAKKYGRTTQEHLVALLIHGIVHLTGRTHKTAQRAKSMESLERKIALAAGQKSNIS